MIYILTDGEYSWVSIALVLRGPEGIDLTKERKDFNRAAKEACRGCRSKSSRIEALEEAGFECCDFSADHPFIEKWPVNDQFFLSFLLLSKGMEICEFLEVDGIFPRK